MAAQRITRSKSKRTLGEDDALLPNGSPRASPTPEPLPDAPQHAVTRSPKKKAADRVDKGRPRSGFEIPRKLLHSSIAPVCVWIWKNHPNVPQVVRFSTIGLTVIVTADVLRFNSVRFERFYERVLGYFMREEERYRVNGVIYYLIGVLLTVTFLPRDIACLSIIILSWCDTAASVFGRMFGKYTPKLPFSGSFFAPRKSMAGTLAAIAIGALQSYFWWSRFASLGDEGDVSWVPARLASTWVGLPSKPPTFLPRLPNPNSTLSLGALSACGGLVAGLAEAIDVFGLDDNLSLPVLFGFILWGVLALLG